MAKKFAMTIGVQKYNSIDLPLKYAANDAEKIRDLLEEEAFEVLHYSDDSSNSYSPGHSNLKRRLKKIGKLSMGSEDYFWFFFSGHGSIHNGLDYLMLSDTHEDIQKSAISVNYVIQQLKKCGAGNIVLFLDMCRDQDQGIKSIKGVREQTKQKALQAGMIIIYSCSRGEYSWELPELQHGAFTYALLELLSTEEGETVEKLNKSLQERVKQLTKNKGRQTPCVVADPIEMSDSILIPKYATTSDYQNEIEEAFIEEKNASSKLPKDSICVEPNIDLENMEEFPSEPQIDNFNWQTTNNQAQVNTLQELLQEREIIEQLRNQSNEKQEEIVTQTQSVLTTSNTQKKSKKFSWKKGLVSAISLVTLAFGTNTITFNRLSQINAQLLPKAAYPGMNYDYRRIRLVDERVNNILEENLAIRQFNQNDIQAGKMAVEILLETGKLEKAAEAIAAVPEQLKDHPEINFLKGRLAWEIFQDNNQNNLIDEAISYWEKAAAKSPKTIQYQNALGFAYYTKGDIEKAYGAWLKVLHFSGKITPVSDNDLINLSVNNREILNAYAGLGLIQFKSAQNLQKTPKQALFYVNKVMGESGKDFHIQELQKNWLW
ncbi:MAG: hypothetical protein F6K35_14545, partial [Okeania sp. SIO2H7]|nr:hypothetical protein [Okeania sp. SIO2H7]